MSQHEKIIKTINALLAKSRDAAVTEAEAEAFVEKAHELLEKYNLAMADLESHGEAVADKPIIRMVNEYHKQWETVIHHQVANLYFCKLWRHPFIYTAKKDGRKYSLLGHTYAGREHNVEIAISMVKYLTDTVKRLTAKHDGNRTDFAKGCAYRLAARIKELAEKKRKEQAGVVSNLPALYVSEDSRNLSFMAEKGIVLKSGKNLRAAKDASSYVAGRQAAEGISLDPQVGKGAEKARISA